jgi:hypothetical protein
MINKRQSAACKIVATGVEQVHGVEEGDIA